VADSDEAGPRVIASPVPGRLARILVEDGDLIRAGDTIGIVEAMKTEFTLRAEARGIVHLRVPEGAQVRQGEVIAEIGGADG
jgi:biotin carboxyl carrier protein